MTDLQQRRLRTLCCGGKCEDPTTCLADLDAHKLAAHDAVLAEAGIPIDKLVSGEWVAVPVEPTGDMKCEGGQAQSTSIGSWGEPGVVWDAMLAARPKVTPTSEWEHFRTCAYVTSPGPAPCTCYAGQLAARQKVTP